MHNQDRDNEKSSASNTIGLIATIILVREVVGAKGQIENILAQTQSRVFNTTTIHESYPHQQLNLTQETFIQSTNTTKNLRSSEESGETSLSKARHLQTVQIIEDLDTLDTLQQILVVLLCLTIPISHCAMFLFGYFPPSILLIAGLEFAKLLVVSLTFQLLRQLEADGIEELLEQVDDDLVDSFDGAQATATILIIFGSFETFLICCSTIPLTIAFCKYQ
eukprot:snap_masked-scaffold_15-processed-gene-9.14-mRNA-1 protein AED:1.00 eAED:1.00 QI:0/0/0/0/1/1/2/0/220